MNQWIKGMDISTLPELEELGAVYYTDGKQGDLLSILKSFGCNGVRLRLWNDPYSEEGKPYGAGTNDLNRTIALAKRCREQELDILLDLHYSDFWADPGKQLLPKAWRKMTEEELEEAVCNYTKEVLKTMEKEGVLPRMVQVGNEISQGLLWPAGKYPAHDAIARFVKAGVRAVRETDPAIRIMLHMDCGGNNAHCREWFDAAFERGVDCDIIGLSYYPFWHGTLQDLTHNMNDLAARYEKDIVVAEVSTGFTMEDYGSYEKLTAKERKGMATKPGLAAAIDYPMTPEGQSRFMEDVMKAIAAVPKGRGAGFYYWEPGWIPVSGSGWANEQSLAYMNDPGPGGNEWANQALFDYDGNALPALTVIRDFHP